MYRHTQTGRIGWLLWPLVALELALAWVLRDQFWIMLLVIAVACVLAVAACSFRTLTIQDEGDYVGILFGPLPLFYKRIAYDAIEHVERGRTRWIDGWGIHWVPGRGWTYNVWGFDCVKLTTRGKTVRLGTDDPEGLLAMLQAKTMRDKPHPMHPSS
jgi:hypothetical protein